MNQEYPIKENYNIVIPPNLFQTWHTKQLPPLMYNAIKKLRAQNPRFHYKLFDDNDCREFIRVYFDADVLNAFDKLIPGAYKADLFRYCVLYKFGGIYLDIKYIHANNFKLINLLEKEHWVLDADNTGVYNALMVCNQGNPILYKAIYKVVENVKKRYYGTSILEPTGPMLLSQFFSEEDKRRFDVKHVCHNYENGRFILFHDYIIFKTYPGYLREQDRYKKVPRYADLWHRRQIYK
jgi:mannosyltransferase OCH1-like enzyme